MSERAETEFAASTLDAVKARIFYLASDVEAVSAPAAMLLRAVAGSIEDLPPSADGQAAVQPPAASQPILARSAPSDCQDRSDAGANIVAWQAGRR